jgi:hypothetical protein
VRGGTAASPRCGATPGHDETGIANAGAFHSSVGSHLESWRWVLALLDCGFGKDSLTDDWYGCVTRECWVEAGWEQDLRLVIVSLTIDEIRCQLEVAFDRSSLTNSQRQHHDQLFRRNPSANLSAM